ncbi:MAG TPA: hypothetical protein DDX54_04815 [Rhodospirillaceae bacterium]|nr:hypothetical protein [Rhodospirillaceae bacterium]
MCPLSQFLESFSHFCKGCCLFFVGYSWHAPSKKLAVIFPISGIQGQSNYRHNTLSFQKINKLFMFL